MSFNMIEGNSEGLRYRFPKGMELPIPPDGMELTKFHGEPRFITAREEGEPVSKAGFTQSQEQDLLHMEAERLLEVRLQLEQATRTS